MKEYIEREAACAYNPPEKKERRYSTYNLDDAFENGYDEHIKQVEAIPAADVVEVVRCRDCIWFADGKWCRNPNNDMVQGGTTREWFCGDGKRKDDADDETV